MEFAEKLKTARELRNLSVDDLAKKMNVSRTTVYDWEAGVSEPRKEKLNKLQEILDINHNRHTDEFVVSSPIIKENVDYGLVDKLMKAYQSTIDSKQQEIESKEKEILRLLDDKQWLRDHIDTLTKGRGFGARQEA